MFIVHYEIIIFNILQQVMHFFYYGIEDIY